METAGVAAPLKVVETAWAKINLTLAVTGRRADGYHELSSLTVFADCGDELRLLESDVLSLAIEGPFAAGLSAGEDNLVLRAARGFAALSQRPAKVAITLIKNLPVAAGIGGGSADAAAVLRGLCRLFRYPPDDSALAALALQLGADVPVCLTSRPALMAGIGEALQPLAGLPDFALVLVNPGVPLSTAEVFRARQGGYSPDGDTPPAQDLDTLLAWLSSRPNDLEAPARALRPEIDQALDALAASPGCRLARMSGSGATCFGLYATDREAQAAAAQLRQDVPDWWIRAAGLRPG